MRKILFLFSHQLHDLYLKQSGIDRQHDIVLFIDSDDQWTYYRFHLQRIALHLSVYRHFHDHIKRQGYQTQWIQAHSLQEAFTTFSNDQIIIFKPTNRYEQDWIDEIQNVTLLDDPLFLINSANWKTLLPIGKTWKLDPLYRQFRKKFHILIDGDEPIGGQYSYDGDNRQGIDEKPEIFPALTFQEDQLTQTIIAEVKHRFPHHPGLLETMPYPVTRKQAIEALEHFVDYRLATFGRYQDAMHDALPWMSHSMLSSSINLGLLTPLEVIQKAEKAYHQKQLPLPAVEGFIRQILGWREYVRGVYLQSSKDYLKNNYFQHHHPLPSFYYDGKTDLNCLRVTIHETIQYGYNHHIQRLMVLSNAANLLGVEPAALQRWFNEMYIDSMEWIVAPNVMGMGLYADGGTMSTKPYIASGAYIHKMSNYCDTCTFRVDIKQGEKACPFNILYWDFISRHQTPLKQNPRMGMMVRLWEKMKKSDQNRIREEAKVMIKRHG
jgi:deoxyribodipyrimidine photolyase-related protein